MIATITLNPSLDKRYIIENFKKNGVFRVKEMSETAGGKGLNVAKVVKLLGEPVAVSGLIGGKNGDIIEEKLMNLGITNEFVKIKGETRSCIAILSNDLSQTEILEAGPSISQEETERFLKKYDEMIKRTTIICASGSIPQNVPSSVYRELISRAKNNNVKFLLDTSGKALKEGIKALPYLIKPNKDELIELTNVEIKSEKDILNSGIKLVQKGIEVVVISLGGEGCIVFNKDRIYKTLLPKVEVVNPVGSGDSMVAGFAVALEKGYSFKKMIKFASAVGTANAMEHETGKVSKDVVEDLMNKIEIEEIINH
ncbi:1-phosphofructokinase [Paramaledivibacter caminithermalis]|uniref:Tagatose-6-phosphate kinase n=1 Tax=Paramaledivibacter caminithermalis (strain DSM 15212 / CIP 107654 / DViRD3) TaxID=1121301 RepID=A0A1M6PIV3_PARC5|nr:1-phosphofructokinase [Paramaledivibacter caminithermalis]SHK07871.1 tagatose 6-phosphate kinase [Paramaledivibacter caminithermalis DSM 15212]